MPLQIKEGRVFKKQRSNKIKSRTESVENQNQHSLLDDQDIVECQDNVAQTIAIDIKLQETMKKNDGLIKEKRKLKMTLDKMKRNENNLAGCFEIEQMVVSSLKKHLKGLQKDHSKAIHEGHAKMQELRNKQHQLKIKEHHCQKDLVFERKANKQLKQELSNVRMNRKELQNAVIEIEVEIKLIRDLKAKNKNHRFRNSAKEKEIQGMRESCKNEIEKLQYSIKGKNNVAEKLKVQEKEQEHKIKTFKK